MLKNNNVWLVAAYIWLMAAILSCANRDWTGVLWSLLLILLCLLLRYALNRIYNPKDSRKLLGCPFCGCKMLINFDTRSICCSIEGFPWHNDECPLEGLDIKLSPRVKDSIEMWNRRA